MPATAGQGKGRRNGREEPRKRQQWGVDTGGGRWVKDVRHDPEVAPDRVSQVPDAVGPSLDQVGPLHGEVAKERQTVHEAVPEREIAAGGQLLGGGQERLGDLGQVGRDLLHLVGGQVEGGDPGLVGWHRLDDGGAQGGEFGIRGAGQERDGRGADGGERLDPFQCGGARLEDGQGCLEEAPKRGGLGRDIGDDVPSGVVEDSRRSAQPSWPGRRPAFDEGRATVTVHWTCPRRPASDRQRASRLWAPLSTRKKV